MAFGTSGMFASRFSGSIPRGGVCMVRGRVRLGCIWRSVIGEASEAIMGGDGIGDCGESVGVIWGGWFVGWVSRSPAYGSPRSECSY